LPGCGLYAGKQGALATTGDGEYIAKSLLAYRAYVKLEEGQSPEQTVDWALSELPESVDVGIIVVNHTGFAGGARHDMAWYGKSTQVPI
jgi:isoaspartyl peptidase/L-asparaginase-like protein (Ntn-hydrolase superfamily)